MPERLQPFNPTPIHTTETKENSLALVIAINYEFSLERPAHKILELLQRVKNPIFVDFNQTLMDEISKTPNPHAAEMLDKLRKDYTIIVLSWAPHWLATYHTLKSAGLIRVGDMLMTRKNWEFMTKTDQEPAKSIIEKYLNNLNQQGIALTKKDFKGRKSFVSTLFPNSRNLTLIDDSQEETQSNAIFNGILVQAFTGNFTPEEADQATNTSLGCTLLEAAVRAKTYCKYFLKA